MMFAVHKGKTYIKVKEKVPDLCMGCVVQGDDEKCPALNDLSGNSCNGTIWQEANSDEEIEYKVIPMEEDKSHVVPLEEQLPGTKYDDGKLDYTLIPPHALQELARNLTEGLKKYRERDNWKKVPEAQERYLKALYRHLEAHRRGEIYDTESSAPNMPHMAAVAVNAMFLLEFMLDPNLTVKGKE